MKKSKFYLGAALMSLACLMSACSSDEPDANKGTDIVDNGEKVYMSVTVSLPTAGGARSETDNPDNGTSASTDKTEVGKDYENKVTNMLIILARKADNSFITYGTVDNNKAVQTGTNVKATTKISKTSLSNYYAGGAQANREVNVFIICNYTQEIYDKFTKTGVSSGDKNWLDEICEVKEGTESDKNTSIWTAGNVLMSNATIATKKLPAKLDDWDDYTSESRPLDLSAGVTTISGEYLDNNGTIRVERSVARFDFKDGSPETTDPNTYKVVFATLKAGDDPIGIVDIRLNKIALVNMSNSFYYFRRVTNSAGNNDGGVCKPELPWINDAGGNYVIDVNYDTKQLGYAAYNFPLYNAANGNKIDEPARDQWYTSKISDVLNKENDNYNDKSYHIWRYATENTVNNTDRMVHGLSTGIVFKGKMIGTEAALNNGNEDTKYLAQVINYNTEALNVEGKTILNHNTNTDPILYVYNGNMYVGWENVCKAATAAATSDDGKTIITTNSFYQAVFGIVNSADETDANSPNAKWNTWNEGGKTNADQLAAFKAAATGNGITLYQSSEDKEDGGWGYYCYYFYWNRHNDNGKKGIIGNMEFAVVRNNVYKLAVTKIDRLGHPRLSDNDTDPEKPDTPDESSDAYITLSVEVLPWTVRLNNIEF